MFIVYIAFFASFELSLEVFFSQKAQIVSFKADKAPTFFFSKYANFLDVFSKDLVVKHL